MVYSELKSMNFFFLKTWFHLIERLELQLIGLFCVSEKCLLPGEIADFLLCFRGMLYIVFMLIPTGTHYRSL